MLSILALGAQLLVGPQPAQDRIAPEDVTGILDEAVQDIRSLGYPHVFGERPLAARPFFITEGAEEPFRKVVPGFDRLPARGRNFIARQRTEVLQCEAPERQCG